MKQIAQRSLVGLTLLGSGLLFADDVPTRPTQYNLPAPTGGMGPLSVPGVPPPPVNMPTPVDMVPPFGPTMPSMGQMPTMSPPFMGPMPGTIGPNYGPGGPYAQPPGMVNPGLVSPGMINPGMMSPGMNPGMMGGGMGPGMGGMGPGGGGSPYGVPTNNSITGGGGLPGGNRPPLMRDYSWIHIDNPEPRQVKVHDIITVIVDEKAESTSDNQYNRQKNGLLKAQLQNFVRIDSSGNLNIAAENSPTIQGRLQSNLQSRGQVSSREGVRYRIAATVVDVLPNGTIILEARKTIRTNKDVWEYRLTGRLRTQDVLANNTVLSENIAEMEIVKSEKGRLRDSTRRGIFLYMYDLFSPI